MSVDATSSHAPLISSSRSCLEFATLHCLVDLSSSAQILELSRRDIQTGPRDTETVVRWL
jgi:hypothetical protein